MTAPVIPSNLTRGCPGPGCPASGSRVRAGCRALFTHRQAAFADGRDDSCGPSLSPGFNPCGASNQDTGMNHSIEVATGPEAPP